MLLVKARSPRTEQPEPLTAAERRLASLIRNALDELASSAGSERVATALRTGNITSALNALNWDGFMSRLGDAATQFAGELTDAGSSIPVADWANLPSRVGLGFQFNRIDPRALGWAESQAAQLVTAVTDSQRDILRQTIVDSYRTGSTWQQTAARVRDHVGLTPKGLEQAQRLHNRVFESSIRDGVDPSVAMTRAQQQSARFAQRLIRQRSQTIARTEILRAQNAGRYLGFQQMVEAGYADPASMKRYRTAGASLRGGVCDFCAPMEGEIVGWNTEFSNGVVFPPSHPNCRCTYTMLPPQRERRATNPNPTDDFTTAPPPLLGVPSTPATPRPMSGLRDDESYDPPPYSLATERKSLQELDIDVMERRLRYDATGESDYYRMHPEYIPPTPPANIAEILTDVLRRDFATIASMPLRIRVHSDRLGKILTDGRFKTTHEVRTKNKGSKWTDYTDHRVRYEDEWLGVPKGLAAPERPVYGYFFGADDWLDDYGKIRVVLKERVKGRASINYADSLDGSRNPIMVRDIPKAAPADLTRAHGHNGMIDVNKDLAAGKRPDQITTIDENGLYWEAQVHGGVTLDDILALEMRQDVFDALPAATKKKLAQSGLEVRIIG